MELVIACILVVAASAIITGGLIERHGCEHCTIAPKETNQIIRVYTLILKSHDIEEVYGAIRAQCPECDLPMYLPLEGGSGSGAYYLVATPLSFTPDDMNQLMDSMHETCTMHHTAVVPASHVNHRYEVSIKDTLGINLGSYSLQKMRSHRFTV